MSSFPILDVAIGLALVYLLLALVCTTLMEWIAQIGSLRGKTLYEGTRSLLGETALKSDITDAYFQHPVIQSLSHGSRRPSYVPSTMFAKTLRDVLAREPVGITDAASRVSPDLRSSLRALHPAGTDVADTAAVPSDTVLAEWYDDAMDRVSGTYKRTTQRVVIWLALGVTIAMNANTMSLTTQLWQNPTLRAYMVERAKTRLEQGPPLETVEYIDPTTPNVTPPLAPDSSKRPNELLADEQTMLGQIFSWSGERGRMRRFQASYGANVGLGVWLILSLFGWIITGLAVSLGAPFWFDTLDKFMRARSSGVVPAKATEKPA